MNKVQEIFNRLKEARDEQKKIKKTYKDALDNSTQYKELTEQLKALKERKKQIEDALKVDFSSEFDRLDTLKADIQNDMELLSDAALTQLISGQSVAVTDKNEAKYDPIFSVKFKKA